MNRSILFQLFIFLPICFITENIKAQESNTEPDSLRKNAVRMTNVKPGDKFTVLGKYKEYFYGKTHEGRIGWIR